MSSSEDSPSRMVDKQLPEGTFWMAEKLVNVDRLIVPVGRAWVDNKDALSDNLCRIVYKKALALKVTVEEYDVGDEDESLLKEEKIFDCQAGLMKEELVSPASPENNTPARFSISAWTAKHNVATEMKDGVVHRFLSSAFFLPGKPSGIRIKFRDAGWRPDETDRLDISGATSFYGVDITRSPKAYRHKDLSQEFFLFERVADNFSLVVGQKIGLVVYNVSDVSAESAMAPEISAAQLRKIYGGKGDVVIHTGEILAVGEKHIEYDINSYGGCSGALLFLLDRNQPGSVPSSEYGKAVAVHSSGHPLSNIDRNIGFILPRSVSLN